MVESFDLGHVPFYWRVKKQPVQPPYDVPARLPFSFTFVEELQLVIQKRNPEVLQWLERVYKEDANVGYLQDGHALAESYGGEFIDFFRRASSLLPKVPASAADIGCGGVYLLQKVRELGVTVKGIDPSPVAAAAGKKAGIEIITDFYPSSSLTEQFDVLFHYDVLEHVEDPVSFLRAHHSNLTLHGGIIFAVPDCTHHIALGDVSMLLHEHLNYFDSESLANVLKTAGFEPLLIEPARHGGVLMCCAVPVGQLVQKDTSKMSCSKFHRFTEKASIALQRFAALAIESKGSDLGLYVPLRAFPYLGQIPSEVRLRFYDDNEGLHGCYFDGFDVAIAGRDNLFSHPPARLVICSLAFGDKIAAKLNGHDTGHMKIVQWTELFESNNE